MKHLDLGFIGFGLIGGSIAKALKKKQDVTIRVYTRRKNPDLEQGVADGIIDELLYDIDSHFSTCDIIFLCAPISKNIEYLEAIQKVMNPDCILTDVGSVKSDICESAACQHMYKRFIGGHPMAGSEKTGYANSSETLLENAFYLLTPSSATPTENLWLLKQVVESTGAYCVIISCIEHDEITAAISHVPHIIAVALVNMVHEHDKGRLRLSEYAAGGFKDITRIASSSPEVWQDICIANAPAIEEYLTYFEEQIHMFRNMLAAKDKKAIHDTFANAGEYRNSIPSNNGSLIAQTYDLYINIADRTGAIATIATILSVNGISIKNIGIIHNREFEDGVLKLELNSEEDALLSSRLLQKNRYEVVKRD